MRKWDWHKIFAISIETYLMCKKRLAVLLIN